MDCVAVVKRLSIFVVLFVIVYIGFYLPSYVLVAAEENSTSGYGENWVLFPDDYGGLRFVNLSYSTAQSQSADNEDDRSWYGTNVYFYLYTQRNIETYEQLHPGNNTSSEYLEPENPIKFITHGWMSNGQSSTVVDIKNAYLANQTLNVVIVDWHEIADEMVYLLASTATRYVGYRISEMASSMSDQYGVSGDQLHLIGHSLGAHVMGYAGSYLKKNNITVSRITGLDPARPLFEFPFFLGRGLDKSDADFVDTIHTCRGILGYQSSHGHADFYPNNGRAPQPGCNGISQLTDACSHARAHQYFAESVNSPDFVAYPCDSYEEFEAGNCRNNSVVMGDMVDTAAQGDFYLHTNAQPKYARGNDENDAE